MLQEGWRPQYVGLCRGYDAIRCPLPCLQPRPIPYPRRRLSSLMARRTAECIYHAESPDCMKSFDPTKGEGDHIIPAAFGEFEGDARLRRICPKCNNRIGRCEQELLGCAPEAMLRRFVNPKSKRLRHRGTGQVKSVAGVPGPQYTADLGGLSQLVQLSPDDPRKSLPLAQLIIPGENDSEHYIRLFPGMRPEQLQKRIADTNVPPGWTARLTCDEQHWEEFVQLVKQAGPGYKVDEGPSTEAGVHRTPWHGKFTMTDASFRAIAKIGFHYYLAHSQRGVYGDEPGFSGIRDFIMNGGKVAEFFEGSHARFVLPFRPPWYPENYCHVLAADESEETAVANLHLFLGPGIDRPAYSVVLGSVGSKVIVPGFVRAHLYLYGEATNPDRYAGRVVSVTVTRFRPG